VLISVDVLPIIQYLIGPDALVPHDDMAQITFRFHCWIKAYNPSVIFCNNRRAGLRPESGIRTAGIISWMTYAFGDERAGQDGR